MSFRNHRNLAGLGDCVVVEESQGSFQACPFTTTRTWQDPGTVLWWTKAKVAFKHVRLQLPEPRRTKGLCCGLGKLSGMSFCNHQNMAGPRDCVVVEEIQGSFRHVLSQPPEPGRTQGLCCDGGRPM